MAEPPNMAVSVRLQHRNLNGTTADIRHDRRIGRIPKYVDQDRSCLNSEILRGPTPHSMRAECVKLRELTPKIRKMRSDAAVSTRMVITFGKGLQPHFDALDVESQDKIYTEIAKAVADRVATSLLALVAHRDETAPHAHGQMLAVNKFGMPISKVATPTVMSELQDMAHQIALKYLPMCERGTKKADRIKRGDDPSKIYNRSVKQLHTDLPKEIEAKQTELDAITSQIPTLTDRVAEMQARVDKLESKERSLTAAEEKRLETYQNRLVDRQAKLEEAQGELSALESNLNMVRQQVSDAEKRRQKAEEDRKKQEAAAKAACEAAQEAQERLQKAKTALGVLDLLRPAHAAAQALSALTEVNQTTRNALFDAMSPNPEQTEDGGEQWALAIRMCDPDFAVDVARHVPRAYVVQTNHETLADHDLVTDEDFGKLIAEMRKEPGGLDAVLALQRREISVEDLDGPADTPAKSWLGRAFDGVKRGFVCARAAVSEKTQALAHVFNSLPSETQFALTRLFRSRDVSHEPTPDAETRRSVFDPSPGP